MLSLAKQRALYTNYAHAIVLHEMLQHKDVDDGDAEAAKIKIPARLHTDLKEATAIAAAGDVDGDFSGEYLEALHAVFEDELNVAMDNEAAVGE